MVFPLYATSLILAAGMTAGAGAFALFVGLRLGDRSTRWAAALFLALAGYLVCHGTSVRLPRPHEWAAAFLPLEILAGFVFFAAFSPYVSEAAGRSGAPSAKLFRRVGGVLVGLAVVVCAAKPSWIATSGDRSTATQLPWGELLHYSDPVKVNPLFYCFAAASLLHAASTAIGWWRRERSTRALWTLVFCVMLLTGFVHDVMVDLGLLQTPPISGLLALMALGILGSSLTTKLVRGAELAKRLAIREAELEATYNSIGDAIVSVDSEQTVRLMNREASTLFGNHVTNSQPQKLGNLLAGVTKESGAVRGAAGSVPSGESLRVVRSGTGRDVLLSEASYPIPGNDGTGEVWVFKDVTEESALREQVHRIQQLNAVSRTTAGMAHDYKNFLAIIGGNLELLCLEHDLPDDSEAVEAIRQGVERADELSRQLMSFDADAASEQEITNVMRVIDGAVALFRGSSDLDDIEIHWRSCPQPAKVLCSASAVESALLNLLLNAKEAMPDGGKVRVVAELVELDRHYCHYSSFDISPGQFVRVSVSDTGVGIPADALPRVFEPLYTTKEQGTGLGLAATFGTVRQCNGAIEVESVAGRGTTFQMYLPIHDAAPNESDGLPLENLRDMAPLHLLVVDDDPSLRRLLQVHLEKEGFRVSLASTVAEADRMIERGLESLDGVLLDLVLPDGEGVDVYTRAREAGLEAPVLFLSASSEPPPEALGDELAGFHAKPFRRGQLLAELGRLTAHASKVA